MLLANPRQSSKPVLACLNARLTLSCPNQFALYVCDRSPIIADCNTGSKPMKWYSYAKSTWTLHWAYGLWNLTMNFARSASCCATCLASMAWVYSLPKVNCVMETSSKTMLKAFARWVSTLLMSLLTTCNGHSVFWASVRIQCACDSQFKVQT